MAKTLIGNIKGKDGRGITSIKKTGTTGSVDTYTITYTDDTTSTFTVNNSDNVSLQRQIVPSAAVESSAIASQAYAAGDYVVVNGILRKVKSAIAKGNVIDDSNSTATTVTGELATLGDSVSPTQLSFTKHVSIDGGNISAVRSGNVVVLSFFCSINGLPPNGNTVKLFSGLPEALVVTRGFIVAQYANFVANFWIDTEGSVYVTNKSDCNDAYWVIGSLVYIAAK